MREGPEITVGKQAESQGLRESGVGFAACPRHRVVLTAKSGLEMGHRGGSVWQIKVDPKRAQHTRIEHSVNRLPVIPRLKMSAPLPPGFFVGFFPGRAETRGAAVYIPSHSSLHEIRPAS